MTIQRWGFWCVTLVAAMAAMQAPAAAAPVPCPGGVCTVSDAGASISTDSEGTLDTLTVGGIDQLAQQRFLATFGANSPMNPLTDDPITMFWGILSTSQDDDANQIVIVFSNSGATVTVTYTLIGGPLTATVNYTILVEVTDLLNGFTLVDYVDFDLMGFFSDDTIAFTMPDTIIQTGKGAVATARSLSPFNFFDVGECCVSAMIARDVNGHLANGAGPVGPGDVSGGFQHNITTPIGESVTLSAQLAVTIPPPGRVAPAPALSPLGAAIALMILVSLGGLALRHASS